MLNIRPHHGMCIGQFKGYGYSEDFVRNMTEITGELKRYPDIQIRLVCGGDSICASCPHLQSGNCTSGQKVMEYDRMVLKLCELSENQILTWREFKGLVMTNILAENKLKQVCTNCSWLSICLTCQGFQYCEN